MKMHTRKEIARLGELTPPKRRFSIKGMKNQKGTILGVVGLIIVGGVLAIIGLVAVIKALF